MRASWTTIVAAAAAGVVGVAVGASLVGIGEHLSEPASEAADPHTQDVVLCTSYALIYDALHHPVATGADALPAIAPLRLALIENPDADPEIRDAVTGAIEAFDAILAKDAKPQGLSEPPPYDPAVVTVALQRVTQVCELTE